MKKVIVFGMLAILGGFYPAAAQYGHNAGGNISSSGLTFNSIDSNHVKSDGLTGSDLRNFAITNEKLASNAVGTAKISGLAVTLGKMAANSVDSTKIVQNSISPGDILNGAILTAKIADGAVTASKLASGVGGVNPAGARRHAGWTAQGVVTVDTVNNRIRIDGNNAEVIIVDNDNDSLIFRPQGSGNKYVFQYKDGSQTLFALDSTGLAETPEHFGYRAGGGFGSFGAGAKVNNTLIGRKINPFTGAYDFSGNVLIGDSATVQATISHVTNSIGIGKNVVLRGTGNIVIGHGAEGIQGSTGVAIGNGAVVSEVGSFNVGSSSHFFSKFYFGGGKTIAGSSSGDVRFALTEYTGSNTFAQNFEFYSGRPTGNSTTGGRFRFYTPQTGSSGTTLQTMRSRVEIGIDGTSTTAPTDSLFNAVSGHFSRGLKVDGNVSGNNVPIYIYKPVDETVTSTSILQNDDHFSFTLAPSKKYVVEGFIYFTSSVAPGFNMDFDGGTATYTNVVLSYEADDHVSIEYDLFASSVASDFNVGANQTNNRIRVQGSLEVNAGGTFVMRFAQSTSDPAPTRVKRGSWMRLIPLP